MKNQISFLTAKAVLEYVVSKNISEHINFDIHSYAIEINIFFDYKDGIVPNVVGDLKYHFPSSEVSSVDFKRGKYDSFSVVKCEFIYECK